MRFKMRQMMVAVAVIAILISFWISAVEFETLIINGPPNYRASQKVVKTWEVGPSPRVEVAVLLNGIINVVQSEEGTVSAALTLEVNDCETQAAAAAYLNKIPISATQEDGAIRIKVIGSTWNSLHRQKADVELRVPLGASLELQSQGRILVGKTWRTWTRALEGQNS
jgi:hypothetical protein